MLFTNITTIVAIVVDPMVLSDAISEIVIIVHCLRKQIAIVIIVSF